MHEKLNTPRSCLRWKPTGRIFNTVGLRWIPTGKMFTDSTIKVDSEPPNGSNDDITNLYECDQTLNVSASTLNLSACTSFNPIKESLRTTLLAPLLKEKKSVRFNALYLQKKRNLLVWIKQKSQENRQKRANTDTGNERAQKKTGIQVKQSKSTLEDKDPKVTILVPQVFKNYTNGP
ncbi:hypothetical protein Tco_0861965 [Tanacetum coccineum]